MRAPAATEPARPWDDHAWLDRAPTVSGGRAPWGERRRYPDGPLCCDRCGVRSVDPAVIPFDTTTGEPIRSRVFEAPGTTVVWPSAVLCTRCWWRLNETGHA